MNDFNSNIWEKLDFLTWIKIECQKFKETAAAKEIKLKNAAIIDKALAEQNINNKSFTGGCLFMSLGLVFVLVLFGSEVLLILGKEGFMEITCSSIFFSICFLVIFGIVVKLIECFLHLLKHFGWRPKIREHHIWRRFSCSGCSTMNEVPEINEIVGKHIQCPGCHQLLSVPSNYKNEAVYINEAKHPL